ncbi:hypothetical protein [Paraburkholderia phosphatilytica]|uniref:hypothetical protein n=1 Tax=Paraburkholderia phosphatilytica TaxID=2282883 RepID=UPI000E529706|nr:hypothetical protein [Paraburkholderia phosphatilytica]
MSVQGTDQRPIAGHGDYCPWLAAHNAAWILEDGFYAYAPTRNTLEMRSFGGKPVWQSEIDPKTRKASYRYVDTNPPSFWISQRVWTVIKARESAFQKLLATLLRPM